MNAFKTVYWFATGCNYNRCMFRNNIKVDLENFIKNHRAMEKFRIEVINK